MHTKIIAEVGVNHNGDIKIAKKLIDIAKNCNADFVKFQLYSTSNLVLPNTKKANYQKNKKKESQAEMLKRYELNFEQIKILKHYAKKKKIKFLLSVFDLKSFELFKKLNIKIIKIPSGENNNFELLEEIKKYKLEMILSTGMTTIKDIKKIYQFLLKGKLTKISLLHCISSYPTKLENVYIKNILKLKKLFNTDIGFSDHTVGAESAICAVSLGASFIEKHITLNNNFLGPDHKSSLNPTDFKLFVSQIRNAEKVLKFTKQKKFSKDEISNAKIVKKSIIAKINIKKGDTFSRKNITTKRPNDGLPADMWYRVLGKKAKKDFKFNEKIKI